MKRLTHLDGRQQPRMVDVSDKGLSHRIARASGRIRLQAATLRLIARNRIAKGNVLVTAELAGVQGAKQTASLIPLCHVLPLTRVLVEARIEKHGIRIDSEVKCTDRTGVEMEALTAVSVALLTVYDMCKAVDKTMTIGGVRLLGKSKQPVAERGAR